MEEMITVEEALAVLSQNTLDFGIESIVLENGIGRVLREDIKADRDFPPYDRVTMDGIAVQYSQFERGQRSFQVNGTAAAGSPQITMSDNSGCLEVMTGAIMPHGVDTVIRYEDVTIANGTAKINIDEINYRQNIHFKGIDRNLSDLIIRKETVLASPEIGVCATVGKSELKVSALPRTIVISTGDELVEIDKVPLPHQIRRSNIYRLKTTLAQYGIAVDTAHLDDNIEQIIETLQGYLTSYDVILLSGGVSKGKFDYLPQALDQIGVSKKFHKIKQRPGKPFWFGTYQNKCAVFALPGNPVSSFVCAHRYFNYWLNLCIKHPASEQPFATLTDDVTFAPDLTYFLEVKVGYTNGGLTIATPVKGNGSGDLANLVDADAFIELPRGKNVFSKGESYPVFFYR
ncbi:MAG: molybdopterin molybdotransferase MoeA [Bacteroidota bacterium]